MERQRNRAKSTRKGSESFENVAAGAGHWPDRRRDCAGRRPGRGWRGRWSANWASGWATWRRAGRRTTPSFRWRPGARPAPPSADRPTANGTAPAPSPTPARSIRVAEEREPNTHTQARARAPHGPKGFRNDRLRWKSMELATIFHF